MRQQGHVNLFLSFTFGDFARLARYLIKTAKIVWYVQFLHPYTNRVNRLLQRVVCRTAGLHVSAFTTRSSRCCSFCCRSSTTRPRHSSSDGTILAACASVTYKLGLYMQCMYPDARRVWTRATVLDGHGMVSVSQL